MINLHLPNCQALTMLCALLPLTYGFFKQRPIVGVVPHFVLSDAEIKVTIVAR